MWFQNDNTAHTAQNSLNLQRKMFLGHVVSLRGDVEWSVQSPYAYVTYLFKLDKHKIVHTKINSNIKSKLLYYLLYYTLVIIVPQNCVGLVYSAVPCTLYN